MVLQEGSEVKLLNTMEEKIALLDKIGIDNLIIHPFDKEFSRLTAEEFVKEILVDKLHVQKSLLDTIIALEETERQISMI